MEMITTDGVVLGRTIVGEKDAIIKILTPSLGVVSASAKGVKNMKSKLSAGARPFCFSEFLLRQEKGRFIVASCVPKEGFYGLSSNIERLSFATYIAELTEKFSPSPEDAKTILPLVLNTLYLFANTSKNPELVKCVFELRMLSLLGFGPELDECSRCGETEKLSYFSSAEGGTVCRTCLNTPDLCPVSENTLSAMRYAQTADNKKAFSFTLSHGDITEFERCTESMCEHILGKRLSSLTYLKQITGKL